MGMINDYNKSMHSATAKKMGSWFFYVVWLLFYIVVIRFFVSIIKKTYFKLAKGKK